MSPGALRAARELGRRRHSMTRMVAGTFGSEATRRGRVEQRQSSTKVAGIDVGKGWLDVAAHGLEDALRVLQRRILQDVAVLVPLVLPGGGVVLHLAVLAHLSATQESAM